MRWLYFSQIKVVVLPGCLRMLGDSIAERFTYPSANHMECQSTSYCRICYEAEANCGIAAAKLINAISENKSNNAFN